MAMLRDTGREMGRKSFASHVAKREGGMGGGGQGSVGFGVINLINALLGSGMLSLPYCFRRLGVVGCILMLSLSCWLNSFSCQCLLLASGKVGIFSYDGLAARAFGGLGRTIVFCCTFCLQMGTLVAYIAIITDAMHIVVPAVVPPGAEPSRPNTMFAIVFMVLLPLCIYAKKLPKIMGYGAYFSLAVVGIFICELVRIGGSRTFFIEEIDEDGSLQGIHNLTMVDFSNLSTTLPVMTFCFACQVALFPVHQLVKQPTPQRMTLVAKRTLIISYIIYFTVGLFGYLAYRDETVGDVLRNFGGGGGYIIEIEKDHLSSVFRVLYGLSLVGTVPIVLVTLQGSVRQMVTKKQHASRSDDTGVKEGIKETLNRNIIEGLGIFSIAYMLAVCIPNVQFVFGIVGATACVTLAYIMPALIYLRIFPAQSGNGKRRVYGVPPDIDKTMQEGDVATSVVSDGCPLPTKESSRPLLLRLMVVMGLLVAFFGTTATLNAYWEEVATIRLAETIKEHQGNAAVAIDKIQQTQAAVHRLKDVHKNAQKINFIQRVTSSVFRRMNHIFHDEAIESEESVIGDLNTIRSVAKTAINDIEEEIHSGKLNATNEIDSSNFQSSSERGGRTEISKRKGGGGGEGASHELRMYANETKTEVKKALKIVERETLVDGAKVVNEIREDLVEDKEKFKNASAAVEILADTIEHGNATVIEKLAGKAAKTLERSALNLGKEVLEDAEEEIRANPEDMVEQANQIAAALRSVTEKDDVDHIEKLDRAMRNSTQSSSAQTEVK